MNGDPRMQINLATQPLRNRRFYRTVLGGLIVLFLVFGGGAGYLLVHSTFQSRADNKISAELELRIQAANKEQGEKVSQTGTMKKNDKDFVAGVNTVILRKNFSWVDFFARLEEALPPNCSITSINPLTMMETNLSASFKVVTPGSPEFNAFIINLITQKFKNISIRNEISGGGRFICEIGLVYDGSR